jgi:GLPGLI family protein
MKSKITFTLVILFFFTFLSKAQIRVSSIGNTNPQVEATVYDTLDYAILRCQYKQRVVENKAQPRKKSEDVMLLQRGNNVSKYSNLLKLIADSTMQSKIRAGISGTEVVENALSLRGKVHDGAVLLKGYPTGKTTYIHFFAANSYSYVEDFLKQDWQLLPDTATILGYICKKAVCTFRCRDYVAWYASDIPVSDGPWKFSGLPGLILKVSDTNKEFSFEAIAIEKIGWKDPITASLSTVYKTSKEKYLKAYKNYMEDPTATLKAVDPNLNLPERNLARPYNLIELCE